MMNAVVDCGWLMLAAGIVIYGTVLLASAAAVKYLFFSGRSDAQASAQ